MWRTGRSEGDTSQTWIIFINRTLPWEKDQKIPSFVSGQVQVKTETGSTSKGASLSVLDFPDLRAVQVYSRAL